MLFSPRCCRLLLPSLFTLLLVALGLAVPRTLTLIDQWQQRDQLRAQTVPLRAQYEVLSRDFPETPLPPREMELIVQTYDIIQSQTHTPVAALNMLSAALAVSPGLQLRSFDWQLEEKPLEATTDQFGNTITNGSLPGVSGDDALVGRVLQGQTRLKVTVVGEAYSPDSLRDAQNQVNALVDALAANPGVTVYASRMPTDVRTDIRIETRVTDGEVRAPFTLELTLENLP